jgi:hypothetical protein
MLLKKMVKAAKQNKRLSKVKAYDVARDIQKNQ